VRFLEDGRIELDKNTVERASGRFASATGMHCSPRETMGAQAERRRSAALFNRRPESPRQQMAQQPHRRAHAVVLGGPRQGLAVTPCAMSLVAALTLEHLRLELAATSYLSALTASRPPSVMRLIYSNSRLGDAPRSRAMVDTVMPGCIVSSTSRTSPKHCIASGALGR